MKKWLVLLCLLVAAHRAPGQSLPGTQPARPPAIIHIMLKDDGGKPIAGARATLHRATDTPDISATSDATGGVTLSRTLVFPTRNVAWSDSLIIESKDQLAFSDNVVLFPAAHIEKALTLQTRRVTVIHVVDAQGQIVAGVPVRVEPFHNTGTTAFIWGAEPPHTDDQGDYTWAHGPLPQGFTVFIGAHAEVSRDTPALTVKLADADQYQALALHDLAGRLLLSGGAPASGWFVGTCRATFTSSMGALAITGSAIEELIPVKPDGSFQLKVGTSFVAVSPEGVPLRYAVNPSTWEKGPHHLTVTLPPTTLSTEQFMDAGKPLADTLLVPCNLLWLGGFWSLQQAGATTTGLTYQGKPLGVMTDANGKYSISIPHGTSFNLEVGQVVPAGQISTHTRLNPAATRDISIAFFDEKHQPLNNIWPTARPFTAAARDAIIDINSSLTSPAVDVAGYHFFIDSAAARLELSVGTPGTAPRRDSIALTGENHYEITLPAAAPLKPFSGRILDPEGHPVADARIYLNAGEFASNWPGERIAWSDKDGRFSFSTLPPQCFLNIFRFTPDENHENLPGWIDTVAVTADNRDVDIRLHPAGTATILLPVALASATEINMERVNSPQTDSNRWATLVFDKASHSLVALFVRPGVYKIPAIPQIGFAGEDSIEVKAGENAKLDWSKRTLPASATTPERWVSVKVTAGGKALSGAQIGVLADAWPREMISEWITEWRAGNFAGRAAAQQKLIAAGSAVNDVLDAMNDPAAAHDVAVLRAQLAPPNTLQADTFQQITSDLTDDQGAIRFKGQPGRDFMIVARMNGQWIGWQHFTLAATGDVALDMRPTRSVIVRYTPDPTRRSDPNFEARIVDPSAIDRRGLMRILAGMPFGNYTLESFHGVQTKDGAEGRFDDLPVGVTMKFSLSDKSVHEVTIKIEAGEQPMELLLKP